MFWYDPGEMYTDPEDLASCLVLTLAQRVTLSTKKVHPAGEAQELSPRLHFPPKHRSFHIGEKATHVLACSEYIPAGWE